MSSSYPLLAFLFTGMSLMSLKPMAGKMGLIDQPGGRKTHFRATPLVGGLGIYVGVIFTSTLLPGVMFEYAPLLLLAGIVLVMGAIDDVKDLTPRTRLVGHSLIALAMAVAAGVQLEDFGHILTASVLELGWLSVPITIFATVGVINAINMTDGIDGLSGSLVCVTLSLLLWIAVASAAVVTASFLILLLCALLAFLSLNFRQPWRRSALVYLGDAGSTMLGFILAYLLISMSQGESALFSPVFALWFLAVPLFDTVHLMFKRSGQGKSPFQPGMDHLHHQLLRLGWRVEAVVIFMTSAAMLFGMVGIAGYYLNISDGVMFLAFMISFAIYSITLDKISTPEPAY